ncbi:hypothetical protein DERF_005854 [Dermatophagoides farinae]|uniref:Uncharacterized protein n=1 Tax=Dermatophagoides farinae TaxID=6954 RepID=A0A922L944_DERFA|nr:uncharacterized protein LOC124490134 [Dermatophagoides farinae]KAH7639191.1 hypothetical protein HUG17_3224 [Dermatophagoides farinae]KAH9522267.1 hypothetical protein DERF_005854 [Dermatophagoides farinae]
MKFSNQESKIMATYLMASILAIMAMVIMANPISQDNNNNGVGGGDNMVVPLDSNSLKSILLYNRLQQLIENEPEMLDLFDMDRNHLSRVIDELLLSQSNQIRVRKFLNVKSNKRAAAMGVDLPDYILHINKGKNFDFSSFREKMQKSG